MACPVEPLPIWAAKVGRAMPGYVTVPVKAELPDLALTRIL